MNTVFAHPPSLFGLRPSAGDMALLLLLFGLLLIYAEFNRPGTILLGACGALLYMLGVYAMLPLEIDPLHAGLVVIGIVLIVLQIRFRLRVGNALIVVCGTLCLVLGLHRLVVGLPAVHWSVALFSGIVFAGVTYILGHIAVLAARNKRMAATHVSPTNLESYPAAAGKTGRTE